MNKYILMTIDSMKNPGKYSEEELKKNSKDAHAAYVADCYSDCYADASYAASYATKFAVYAGDVDVEHYLNEYFELSGENRADYEDELGKQVKGINMTYQEEAYKFAKYEQRDYPFLALGEESGEVMGKLAKFVRKYNQPLSIALVYAKHPTHPEQIKLREDLKKELGDVMWQVAACCTELGFTLDEVQQANLDKLGGRDERGTIVGEGDER